MHLAEATALTRRLFSSADWTAICQVVVKSDLLSLAGSIQLFVGPPLGKPPLLRHEYRTSFAIVPTGICVCTCVQCTARRDFKRPPPTFSETRMHASARTRAIYWRIVMLTLTLCGIGAPNYATHAIISSPAMRKIF